MASPLVTAMIRGGVAILDEGNRMSEKSWASLAPLLDNRRYVESIVAGVKIKAHADFRLVATMNEDSSTFDLPEYIHSRLQPQILIDFPEREEELAILRENLPFSPEEVLEYVTDFLQQAHAADESYTVRDGMNIARYALKLRASNGQPHETNTEGVDSGRAWRRSAASRRTVNMDSGGIVRRGNLAYLPVVPGRLEFALQVRRRLLEIRPIAVAVELPVSLEDEYRAAAARLPQMSVILIGRRNLDDEEDAMYVPVEAGDAVYRGLKDCTRTRRRSDVSRCRHDGSGPQSCDVSGRLIRLKSLGSSNT